MRLFDEHGYEATTMDAIAKRAGIARRTLFSYYESKAAIAWDGLEEAGASIVAALSRTPPTPAWREVLQEMLPTALRYPEDDTALLRRRLLVINSTPALQARLASAPSTALAAMAAFIAASRQERPEDLVPVVAAQTYMGAMTSALLWWASSGETDPRIVVRRALAPLLLT